MRVEATMACPGATLFLFLSKGEGWVRCFKTNRNTLRQVAGVARAGLGRWDGRGYLLGTPLLRCAALLLHTPPPTTIAPHTSVHCTTQIPRKQSWDSASINSTARKTTTKQRCKCISREKILAKGKEGSASRKRIWPPRKWNRKWLKMEVRSQPKLVAASRSITHSRPWFLAWTWPAYMECYTPQRPHPPTCCDSSTTPNRIRPTLALVKGTR